MRKSNLQSYQNIGGNSGVSGDMSAASITSKATDIRYMDNIGIQLQWTGSPVGNFQIQVSMDYNQDQNGNVLNAGTWIPISLPSPVGGINIATSLSSPMYFDLNQLTAPFIRVVYTKSSGSGTLSSFIAGKMI